MPSANTTAAIDNLTLAMQGMSTSIDGITAALILIVAALQITKLFEFAILFGVLALALVNKDSIFYLIAGIITILISTEWVSAYPGVVVILWGLGIYLITFRGIIPLLQSLGSARGLSQFKAMFKGARGKGE